MESEMRRILLAAAAAVSLFASPALAQSYDPDIGSGNIVGRQLVGNQTYPSPARYPARSFQRATDAYAQSPGFHAQSPGFRSNYHWPVYDSQGRDLNGGGW
jgi:hypothetical protein